MFSSIYALGIMTLSMTWMMPFEHLMSVFTTLAVPTEITWSTFPTLIAKASPLTVGVVAPERPITY